MLRIFAKSMSATEESDVSLKDVFSTILNWRTAEQVDVLLGKLLQEGIYVIGFSFPVVPKGEARIRVQISAAHSIENLDHAINSFINRINFILFN